MGKAKRSINPADAHRKAQRKRELKKHKEDRKRARDVVLAKKDTGKVQSEITRLEAQSRNSVLDSADQARLEQLKADAKRIEKAKKSQGLTGAQAAYAQQQEQQNQNNSSRKLVYNANLGKFVPVKERKTTKTKVHENASDSDTSDSSLSDSDDDSENSEESEDDGVPLPSEPSQPLASDDSEDEDIPLPPGPPPRRPFENQWTTLHHNAAAPPPPPPPPGRPPPPPPGPPPMHHGRIPPPPPPGRPPHPHGRVLPPPPSDRPPYHQANPMSVAPYPYDAAYPPSHYTPPVSHASTMDYTPQYQSAPILHAHPQEKPTAQSTVSVHNPPPTTVARGPVPASAIITAEPQLRDLQKELVGLVPASLRRKRAQTKQVVASSNDSIPAVDSTPEFNEENEE